MKVECFKLFVLFILKIYVSMWFTYFDELKMLYKYNKQMTNLLSQNNILSTKGAIFSLF